LPFLRFTRDKRGYETTSLVHAVRRGGRSRQRILYWFRTPPGVKVGRPALDEDAIRWIEEHNPDIEFNWPKILEAQPPAETPPDEARNRRSRHDKAERRRKPKTSGVPPEAVAAQSEQPSPEMGLMDEAENDEVEQFDADTPSIEEVPASSEEEPASGPLAEEELVEAIEQLTHPEAEEKIEPSSMPAEQNIGTEQLTRLRARYAELQARITERGGDLERIKALRAQAEPLNPDTWVTGEEVRKGVEEFEPRIRDLRAALGLRRRRRSRRGGRWRRGGGGGAPPAETPPESSE
jgi:hypothetical protein